MSQENKGRVIKFKFDEDGYLQPVIKDISIVTVNNGFLLSDESTGQMWVFERPASLTSFMEKWAVERKKEMGKS